MGGYPESKESAHAPDAEFGPRWIGDSRTAETLRVREAVAIKARKEDMRRPRPHSVLAVICAAAVLALASLAGCAGGTEPGRTTTVTQASTTTATAGGATTTGTAGEVTTSPETVGELPSIVVPTLPAKIPAYATVDPATGLHMTGTPKVIDLATYRLKVDGMVAHPLSLSYDDLRRLPKVTATPKLVCPGVFVDVTTWSGVPLHLILEMAGVQPGATEIVLKAADGHYSYVNLTDALKPENFLAYQWKDQPLPVLHGFPLRAVFPDQPGDRWVKWLLEIVVQGEQGTVPVFGAPSS